MRFMRPPLGDRDYWAVLSLASCEHGNSDALRILFGGPFTDVVSGANVVRRSSGFIAGNQDVPDCLASWLAFANMLRRRPTPTLGYFATRARIAASVLFSLTMFL
jgi:hypothetical protein